jgi:hypothetical protein
MTTVKHRRYRKKTSKKTANKRRKTNKNKTRRSRKRKGSGPKKSKEEVDTMLNLINEKLAEGGYDMHPPNSLNRAFFKYSQDDINRLSPGELEQIYIAWKAKNRDERKTNRYINRIASDMKLQRTRTANQEGRQQKRRLIPISPFKERANEVNPVRSIVGKKLFESEKDTSISKSDVDTEELLKDPFEYTTNLSNYPGEAEEQEDAALALFDPNYDGDKI